MQERSISSSRGKYIRGEEHHGKDIHCIRRYTGVVRRDHPAGDPAEIHSRGAVAGSVSGGNVQHRAASSVVPLIAGFEKEDKYKILRAFPDADYLVCSIECSADQKAYIERELNEAMENRFRYHYAVLGLPFILMNVPFYQKNHYTCSSYIARLLEEAGVCTWDRHFSLVTPRDFLEYEKKEKIFEGSLYELTAMVGGRRMVHRPDGKHIPAAGICGALRILNIF